MRWYVFPRSGKEHYQSIEREIVCNFKRDIACEQASDWGS